MTRISFSCFLLVLLASSCKTLPSVTSFVEASSQLRKGVKSGMDAVTSSLLSDDMGDRTLSADEKKLKGLFSVIDKSLLGLTAYAGAIDNLVKAGNAGEQNALQVASSLTEIVDQFNAPAVSEVLGVTSGLVAKLNGQITKVKAAKKLDTIMAEASPVVDSISVVLPKILTKLSDYNKSVYRSKRSSFIRPNSFNKNIIDYETQLKAEHVKIYEKLALISQYKAGDGTLKLEDLKQSVGLITDEKDVDKRQADLITQTIRINTEQQRITPITNQIREQQKVLLEQFNTIEQLFSTAKEGVISWGKAHESIRQQLATKGYPNFQELSELVEDLKELRAKIKSLNA